VLLVIIAAAAFLCTLCGGLLALRLRDKLHLILGFSAGAVIGVAFFDLLPEAVAFGAQYHSAAAILSCTAAGFLFYLVLDRILLFHGDAATRGRFAAAVLCVHSLLDGIAVGVAFQASHAVGITVAIAVLTHDFSDGINAMNVVLKNRGSTRQGMRWLLLDAAAPVIGIAATFFIAIPANLFGVGLASLAGFFLYIGASDLIPESYHAHPKFLTTAMTLAGAAVLYCVTALISR
jgi:zinc transporter ZupT